MGGSAHPFPDPSVFDLERVESVFRRAAAVAQEASSAMAAVDAALSVIHDGLEGAGASALVIEHGRLWPVGVRGYSMIPAGLPLDAGVVGRAVMTSEVQLVVDVESDPDYVAVRDGVTSELAVPLSTSEGLIGLINIETSFGLPAGSDAAVIELAVAITGSIEELRTNGSIDLSSLARLFVWMSALREPIGIAEVAVRTLGRILPIESSRLLVLSEGQRRSGSAEWSAPGGPDPLSEELMLRLRDHVGPSAAFELLDAGELGLPELVEARIRSVVLIPLRANGQDIGLLAGASRFATKFDRAQAETAALLAAHAAASLDAALALDRERQSAHTDTLTGLLNRRGLEERLERDLSDAQEGRRPLSLVVLDCDDFKDVNDRAGHEFGDALLREVGLVIRSACPEGGAAGRLGGDEFVVMLPGSGVEEALAEVARLRRELAEGLADAGFPLRLSAGVATYPYDGAGASQLLRAADQALYRAKAGGKNLVVAFREIVDGAASTVERSDDPQRHRPGSGRDGSTLLDVIEATAAIWSESSVEDVLERLSKAIAYVVGATATNISRIDGPRLTDTTKHTLRDVDLGADIAYVIADFPVTQAVLETLVPKSISFLDDDLDGAEAFVLRELQMNSALLVPVVVHGDAWGLVEIYDMRLRRYDDDETAVAGFLVGQAARRIEALGATPVGRRLLPVFRMPLA
ncbi:diguanylate cyclase domain-containing protein [Gaiella sp.]|uniref:diguanylate cyclase n=1 Tax=Gaiella sp. TaxID=2663207 RepID=UPI003983804C